MKVLAMITSAAVLVSGCATYSDRDDRMGSPAAAATALSPMSMNYMQMAHSGDMFEIESSRLALQISQNRVVRSFAQMMVDDHSRLEQEMMAMARNMSLNMDMASMQMAPHHMDMLQRLRAATPANFDMMYHREQMMAHQEALNLHRTYAANGDNEALRALAARAAPIVEMHLSQLQSHGMHMQGTQGAPAGDTIRRRGERG